MAPAKQRRNVRRRQHSLSRTKGRARKRPGMGGSGKFFHIQVRPKREFISFRIQDVGEKGHLERLAGRRSSGSWDTVSWLISKQNAHIGKNGRLVIDSKKARTMLKQIRGAIVHKKGDVFQARPRRNVPEKEKPTLLQRRAQARNIKKAQQARRKRA